MHGVQHSVDELHRLFVGEFARQLQCLVDGHRRGRAAALDLVDRKPQNIAIDRAGTKGGNKGFDAAMTAIEMANLMRTLRQGT